LKGKELKVELEFEKTPFETETKSANFKVEPEKK